MAWAALLGAGKADALKLELGPNQAVQVRAPGKHVAPGEFGARGRQPEPPLQSLNDFQSKERDLPFVVRPMIEEPVAPDAAAGDAFHLFDAHEGMSTRRLAVMAEEVMAGG